MKKSRIWFFVLFQSVIGIPALGQRLTIDEAVNIALVNNERIKQYEERRAQKQYQNLEAWGNFLPTVTMQGSYNYLNKDLSIDLNPIRNAIIQLQASDQLQFANITSLLTTGVPLTAAQQGAVVNNAISLLDAKVPPFKEKFKDQTYRSASVIGVQPLFIGGKLIAAKRYASAELNASEIEYDAIRNEVIQQTISSYLGVVLLKDVVRTRNKVLIAMNSHKRKAYRLLEEGVLAYNQVLRADVAVAEAERQLFDDQNKINLALLSLKHTLGLPEEDPFDVTDSLIYIPLPDSLEYFLLNADKLHPTLRILQEKKKAANAGFYKELSEFLPHIVAFGKYELYPQYLSLLEPRWIVGLQLNMNFFSGIKKYARLEHAIHLEREVEYIKADVRKKINLLINKKYSEAQNARCRYEKLQKNLALANENLRFVTKRFETGMASSLDVIDAQLIVEKNEIESKESLYQYFLALIDLYTLINEPEKVITLLAKEN